mgnify:CR=1 FL=1
MSQKCCFSRNMLIPGLGGRVKAHFMDVKPLLTWSALKMGLVTGRRCLIFWKQVPSEIFYHWQALRPHWQALRPLWRALRPLWQALDLSDRPWNPSGWLSHPFDRPSDPFNRPSHPSDRPSCPLDGQWMYRCTDVRMYGISPHSGGFCLLLGPLLCYPCWDFKTSTCQGKGTTDLMMCLWLPQLVIPGPN